MERVHGTIHYRASMICMISVYDTLNYNRHYGTYVTTSFFSHLMNAVLPK